MTNYILEAKDNNVIELYNFIILPYNPNRAQLDILFNIDQFNYLIPNNKLTYSIETIISNTNNILIKNV